MEATGKINRLEGIDGWQEYALTARACAGEREYHHVHQLPTLDSSFGKLAGAINGDFGLWKARPTFLPLCRSQFEAKAK